MKSAKKKRLELKGWKVGTAAEFLSLSPEESAAITSGVREFSLTGEGKLYTVYNQIVLFSFRALAPWGN